MRMTEETRNQLQIRYEREFTNVSSAKRFSPKTANQIFGYVKRDIKKCERNGSAVCASTKRNIISLLRFYHRPSTEKQYMQVQDFVKQMIKRDLDFIGNYEKAEEFGQFLLADTSLQFVERSVVGYFELFARAYEAKVKKQILAVVQEDAQMEYQEALEMERKFILHIGGTNSGKTYESIERLKTAYHGVYAGPLRLLALEIYDKLCQSDVPCSMITGEEQYINPKSRVSSCTVEMVDLSNVYDIVVIDEAQMISDPYRGHAWSRLLMGIKAKEIHVCLAPEAEHIIMSILNDCNGTIEVKRHVRDTELVFEDHPFNMDTDVRKGDALVLFSKKAVLDVAARLEKLGHKVSVIYGSLPPQIRRKQFALFLSGETEVVVATDAIGLGVNLPIRRIVFMEVSKFDGIQRRPLNEFEVRQIAGRAGRRGMYEQGFVTAQTEGGLAHIKSVYPMEHMISYARVGFPMVLLELDEPLDVLLSRWYEIPPSNPVFRKIDIQEMLKKYKTLLYVKDRVVGFEDKRTLFSMVSCDVDTGNRQLLNLWKQYCLHYTADVRLQFPDYHKVSGSNDLEKLEIYYRMLDVYHQFSIRMGKELEEDRLRKERFDTEERIMEELLASKEEYIRRCRYCGKVLSLESRFAICDRCYKDTMRWK